MLNGINTLEKSYEAIYNTEGEWTANDINDVKAGDIPRADIWSFGFPCTDISRANNEGEGLRGKRSGLFYTVMRLLEKVEEKPTYLLKMLMIYYLSTEGGTLLPLSLNWTNRGTMLNGKFLTLTNGFPKVETEFLLSDILENHVDQQYFLSSDKVKLL